MSEEKKIEKVLKAQLEEKEDIYNTFESEIVHLRKEMEKSTRSSIVSDEIINHHRAPSDRTGLGYNKKKESINEEASTSSKQPREEITKIYAHTLRNPIKVENHKREEQYDP
jgi:hypothetical protein